MSLLSKPDILKHYKAGNIVVEPFNTSNLANTSYDVRLGNYFYRQQGMKHTQTLNPFWQKSMEKMYSKVEEAIHISEIRSQINPFHNFKDTDAVILISPGETILAHTLEFIGGRNGTADLPAVTTEMRARSSVGRLGIAVCKCAGWGDIGYVNRWTMEITNFSSAIIPLPVGMRIAQIIFHSASRLPDENDNYHVKGKYQLDLDVKKLKKKWKPVDMLPKLYLDKDLGKFDSFWNY